MRALLEFAYDETKDANVRLQAIQEALNRAGLQPIQTLEIGPTGANSTSTHARKHV
jgi:hypothetical protein